MPPGFVLNKFDLDFPAAGFVILRPTFFVFVAAGTVDGIAVLDEGIVVDGREAVVLEAGTRTLISSRRGCVQYIEVEDEPEHKPREVSKEKVSTRGLSEVRTKQFEAGGLSSGYSLEGGTESG